jgi:hypothetical protein
VQQRIVAWLAEHGPARGSEIARGIIDGWKRKQAPSGMRHALRDLLLRNILTHGAHYRVNPAP